MNALHVCKWSTVGALMALGMSFGLHEARSAQPPPPLADAAEEVQVLTRGPVHEAFAETVTFDPEPGIVVPKAPPAAIEELPPDQKPEGDNVAWIPGYWGWDDERSDFLWVSGIWRNLPPGRQWVTVCLLVIGKHVPQLSFLDTLLGNEPVFEPTKRVYQRLLAGDQEEATDVVDDDLENKPLVEVYDTLLIPALALWPERRAGIGGRDPAHLAAHGIPPFLIANAGKEIQSCRDLSGC